MRVAIETLVSEKAFGVILGVRVDECGHPAYGRKLRVKATSTIMVGRPVPGETWEVSGEIQETRYGPQIEATRAVRAVPTGKLIREYLAAHVPGVGPERAKALWDRFGEELTQILDHPDYLDLLAETLAPDRPLLGPRLAAACQAAWREARAETLAVEWLSARGIEDVRAVRTILKVHGESAIERLSENAYCLVPLMPWMRVDRLGLQLLAEAGVADPRGDRRRLVGAVDAAVKRTLQGSATAISDADLRVDLSKLLATRNAALIDAAITAGRDNRAILPGVDGAWRAPGAAAMEEHLTERFRRMLRPVALHDVAVPPPGLLRSSVEGLRIGGRDLHPEQVEAILRALQSPLAVLTGGAGVGKTTVTRIIADTWEHQAGGRVVLCALAGKAALRLSHATGRLAMTMARLIHQLRERAEIERQLAAGDLDAPEADRLNRRCAALAQITPHTLVVVDEASMVDLASLYNLVSHMPEGARLLLVGDEGQLPPVSFGIVFHRLVLDPAITARLTVVHRQREDGGIPAVSRAIRERRMPTLPDYAVPGEGVSIRRCAEEKLAQEVEAVWRDLGGLASDTLIVTPTWKGAAGVEALNERLQNLNAAESPLLKGYLGQWFSVGDPVMWTRNDYKRGLFNRLMGRVVAIDLDTRSATVQFDGMDEPVELGSEDLGDLALAYAITVHSSQGSQAPAVIMPLYQTQLLDPSLIYTAITRAEHQVVFVGEEAVIEDALRRPLAADTRLVGFEWRTVEGRGQDNVLNPCPPARPGVARAR